MSRSTAALPANNFLAPPRIVFKEVDPSTGLLSTRHCPDGIREAFIEGTEPQRGCDRADESAGGMLQWLKSWYATP